MNGLTGLFNNENNFIGKFTNQAGIFIAANLLFVLFSLPIVTTGASLSALYYVMLKYQRGNTQLNPFRTFWIGFRDNFKYATFFWILLITGVLICKLEIFWCGQFSGPIQIFRYLLEFLMVALIVFGIYIFPVLSAFRASKIQQFSNALFFAGKSVLTLLISCILLIGPFIFTYLFSEWLPFFAFFWCFCGFSLFVWLHSRILLQLFKKYLPQVNYYGEILVDKEKNNKKTKENYVIFDYVRQQQILEDMKRIGM